MRFIAHRGASHDVPENTLAAFRLGWAQGAEAVELDLHHTRDGALLVSHDADTQRTTGVAKVIAETLLAELRALDAGAWRGEGFRGERLPTLAEVLALLPDGKQLVIELKCGTDALPELVRVIAESGKAAAQVELICFELAVCAAAKKLLPSHRVSLLAELARDSATRAWSPSLSSLIAQARHAGLDGLGLGDAVALDAMDVRTIHAAGLQCAVWTVDDPATARGLRDAGLDALTTNRPGWLRAQLRGGSSRD